MPKLIFPIAPAIENIDVYNPNHPSPKAFFNAAGQLSI